MIEKAKEGGKNAIGVKGFGSWAPVSLNDMVQFFVVLINKLLGERKMRCSSKAGYGVAL